MSRAWLMGFALCATLLPMARSVGAQDAEPEPDRDSARTEGTEGAETTPWEGTADTTLPPFLQDTEKRVVDERPPPTEQQLEGLRQLEEEVDRFTESGGAYRDTVTSLVRREYLQQRRARDRWYGTQIEAEDQAFNDARETAIGVFEDFIRRYPTHAKYTPDAMFRLGELYFERSEIGRASCRERV